ncbi:YHS domain-containing (seleno)protein [Pseudomonadota bacterium]
MSKILFILSFLLAATAVNADTLQYATDNGAIDGYDTVAYFTNGRPERGSPGITAQWNGVEWRFASEENRDIFIENPQKYAPQYGGFCALGMAHGGDVPTDPEAWTIWNGKLYLNMIDEVRTTWNYNPDKLIERADRQWQAMNQQQ